MLKFVSSVFHFTVAVLVFKKSLLSSFLNFCLFVVFLIHSGPCRTLLATVLGFSKVLSEVRLAVLIETLTEVSVHYETLNVSLVARE